MATYETMSADQLEEEIESLNKKKSAAMQMEMLDKAVECKQKIQECEIVLGQKRSEEAAAAAEMSAQEVVKNSSKFSLGFDGRSDAHHSAYHEKKKTKVDMKAGDLHSLDEIPPEGLEKIIHDYGSIIMYICYGVYIFWGFVCFGVGVVAMGSNLESSKIGYGVFLIGLAMIGVGVAGLMATHHRWWHIMLVVECGNVALFIAMFGFSLCALLLALGIADPVRSSTEETWVNGGRQQLEIDGQTAENKLTYCEEYGGDTCLTGDATDGFYVMMKNVSDHCDLSADEFITMASDCSKLTTHPIDSCRALAPSCYECDRNCKDKAIAEVKSLMEPAAVMSMLLFFFMTITAVSNHMLTSTNTYGFIDFKDKANAVGALVMNCVVCVAGIALIITGAISSSNAGDACKGNKSDDCGTSIGTYIILLGVLSMITAALVIVGMGKAMNLMIKIANTAMICASVLLLFGCIFIGIASGTIMKELSANYEDQFTAIKNEMEAIDRHYCDFKYDPSNGRKDCLYMTQNKTHILNDDRTAELDDFKVEWVSLLRDHQYKVMNSGDLPWDNIQYKKFISCKKDPVCEACGFNGGMFEALNLELCPQKDAKTNIQIPALKNYIDAVYTTVPKPASLQMTGSRSGFEYVTKTCDKIARMGWCKETLERAKTGKLRTFKVKVPSALNLNMPASYNTSMQFRELCPRACGPWPKAECKAADPLLPGSSFPEWRRCSCNDDASRQSLIDASCGCGSWNVANSQMKSAGFFMDRRSQMLNMQDTDLHMTTTEPNMMQDDCYAGHFNNFVQFPYTDMGYSTSCGAHLSKQIQPNIMDREASVNVFVRDRKNMCEVALLSSCKDSQNHCLPCSSSYFDEDSPATSACVDWLGMKVDMTCRAKSDCKELFTDERVADGQTTSVGELHFRELQELLDGQTNGFCDMPDDACRAKLQYETKSELENMWQIGAIVIFFMLFVMFVTQMIVTYWWKHNVALDKEQAEKKAAKEAGGTTTVNEEGETVVTGPPAMTAEEKREKMKTELKRLDAQKELGIIDEMMYMLQKEALIKQASEL